MDMASVIINDADSFANAVDVISLHDQEIHGKYETQEMAGGSRGGICAICLDEILLHDVALVKGCEHEYWVNPTTAFANCDDTMMLDLESEKDDSICLSKSCNGLWALYKQNPTCPQCKFPFEFLNIHRTLDGSIHDYMFEESVCLLLRASWFKPMIVEEGEDTYTPEEYFPYEEEYDEEDDDIDEGYFRSSSGLRIGNRRWGDSGYMRAGRQEARPVYKANPQEATAAACSSRELKKKEPVEDKKTGRRAKRTLKREAEDKKAAAKHEEHLARLGRI